MADKTVHSPTRRMEFVEQLPQKIVPAAEQLYAQYDALVPGKAAAEQELVTELRRLFGSTMSTKNAASSLMRLAVQLGHTPLFLQLKGSRRS